MRWQLHFRGLALAPSLSEREGQMRSEYRVSSLAALLIACGGVTTGPGDDRANQPSKDTEADRLACVQNTATSGWSSGDIGYNNVGNFSVEFDATPGSGDEDAIVGLAT